MYCYFESVLWGPLHVESTHASHAIEAILTPKKLLGGITLLNSRFLYHGVGIFWGKVFLYMSRLSYKMISIQPESYSFCHTEPNKWKFLGALGGGDIGENFRNNVP